MFNFPKPMSRKKKILLIVIAIFIIHFLTWKVWGEVTLLKKGFSKLENNPECERMYSGLPRTVIYEGKEHIFTSQRVYINQISRTNDADSVRLMMINGKQEEIFSYRPGMLQSFSDQTDSANVIFQLFIVSEEWISSNPYLQDASFSCWELGSDIDDGYEPLLVWGFWGWLDISNKYLNQAYWDFYVDYRMKKEREG